MDKGLEVGRSRARLACIVRGEDGFLTLRDLGVCEGWGGRFGVAVPAESLAIVERASAERLAVELGAWAKKAGEDEPK